MQFLLDAGGRARASTRSRGHVSVCFVGDEQRKIIYAQRNEILESAEIRETIGNLRHGALESVFREYIPEESVEEEAAEEEAAETPEEPATWNADVDPWADN